jgi:hypothetical protein
MPEIESQDPLNGQVRKSREKSVRYPAFNLEECLNFLSMIHSIGGKKEAPIESVLSKMNITTKDNRRYKYLTSSAEIFGLIKKSETGITPTEFGTLILYPPDGEGQRKQLLVEAFKTPQIYQKIIERYSETILPNTDILKNIFYNYDIARNALDTAVSAFLDSAKFAGVLDQNNRLLQSPINNKPSSQQIPPESGQSAEKQTGQNPASNETNNTQKREESPDLDVLKYEIRTASGKKASIHLPKDWVEDDIDLLINLLRVFSPEVKNK